jgi:hypothetical protein
MELDEQECSFDTAEFNVVEGRTECEAQQLPESIEIESNHQFKIQESNEEEEIQMTAFEPSSSENSLNYSKSESRVSFLLAMVDKSFNNAKTGLDRNYDCLQKVFDDLLQGRQKCLEEMTTNAQNLKSLLKSAISVEDEVKRSGLIDCLEACFSVGHWVDLSFKPKCLDDCKTSMNDFVSYDNGGVKKVKEIFEEYLGSKYPSAPEENILKPNGSSTIDSYLVTVMAVEDPGSFYVVRYCDMDARRNLFNFLKENSHLFPIPEEIICGKRYAVCNDSGKWSRGVCRKICGDYACGGLNGKFYQFFLLDEGHTVLINSFSIRILPRHFLHRPPMAEQCSLNQNFYSNNIWGATAISAFKQMVRRSPMNMKVFGCEGGVLNVDLAQLACFGEDNNIVSVRDALVLMGGGRPTTSTQLFVDQATAKRVKPRFSKTTQPSEFIGIVTSPYMPYSIYVQVKDDQLDQFRDLQQQLQIEYRDASNTSPSLAQQPQKGIISCIFFL